MINAEPVARCGAGTIAAAPTRRSRHQHRRRSPELHRPHNSTRKRTVDAGQQPQRREAGRCRSVATERAGIGAVSCARVRADSMINAAKFR